MFAELRMNNLFKPPLAVHFVWHPSDKGAVTPILDSVRTNLARDVNRPFSRGLNIPLFFYSSECPNDPPADAPQQQAERDVLFVFTSVNTVGRESWKKYIDQFPLSNTLRAVPVALDHEGLNQGSTGSLKKLNFLRGYGWTGNERESRATVAMAHEIFRHGFIEINEGDKGKSSSIKIFLSHAKAGDTGRLIAEDIKRVIDSTNMSRFFDALEIAPGFKFDEEIIRHIKDSTLVAIRSDAYSSRYWCQREILCAKEHHRPIIVVDCLEQYEDRVFPAGANIPCVHVLADSPLQEPDILRILTAVILETIRHHHAQKTLKYYQSQGWITTDCVLSSRPPEIRQVITIKSCGKSKICYPEPSIYAEEADWLARLGMEAFTPLWCSTDNDIFKDLRVGISISDIQDKEFSKHHLHADHLKRLAQDISRHLLARTSTLIYGGDLRKDGFTEFILDEAIALKNRLNRDNVYVENHLAWPLYVADPEITAWRARYCDVMKTVEYDIPGDVLQKVDIRTFLPPNGTCNKYVWSRCLSEMRQSSIHSSHAQICAGGKLSGYNGKMPGVLEEILTAVEKKKPIYLLGGFGGVVGEVTTSILRKSISTPLTEAWQISYNSGYIDLQNKAKTYSNHADYERIKFVIRGLGLSEVAKTAGLDEGDYLRLMQSPFVDECVHLIVKGLKRICSIKGNSKKRKRVN